MTWDSITWIPLADRLPGGAADLADLAEGLRPALDEALSRTVGGPVALGEAVAARWEDELPEGFVPLASVELLGGPRRLVAVALPPLPEGSEPPVGWRTPDELIRGAEALLRAADETLATLLGEGLAIGPAEAGAPGRPSLLVRLTWVRGDGDRLSLVVAVAEAAVEELVAHVAALRALAGSPGESPDEPVGEVAAGDQPSPGETGVPAPAVGARETGSPAGSVGTALEPPSPGPIAVPATGVSSGDGPASEGGGGASFSSWSVPELGPAAPAAATPNLDLLLGVNLQVTVEIGRASLPIREILTLGAGSIVELDKLAGDKVDVLVNGHLIAQGEVVVVDENFGVRITDVVSRQRRLLSADGAA
jgi:flagellar motor switch protein FliN